jgi:ABC-type bacteriocin/lantibiotic exporter with double-glycine peptidase domain
MRTDADLGSQQCSFVPALSFVRQRSDWGCGLAALYMVVGAYDRTVDYDDLEGHAGANRKGLSATTLVRVARLYAVSMTGIAISADSVLTLPGIAILYWTAKHYVVLVALTAISSIRRRAVSGPTSMPFGNSLLALLY